MEASDPHMSLMKETESSLELEESLIESDLHLLMMAMLLDSLEVGLFPTDLTNTLPLEDTGISMKKKVAMVCEPTTTQWFLMNQSCQ